MRYAIIGFGCAGYHAAKAIRAQDPAGEIHVFESEQHPPANPMLTTYYASGALSEDHRFPFGALQEVQSGLSLQLHMGQTVQRVDPEQKRIYTEDGQVYHADRILISTGAYAFVPGIEGLPDPRMYTMRTVADADLLKQRLAQSPARKAVVVGASTAILSAVSCSISLSILWRSSSFASLEVNPEIFSSFGHTFQKGIPFLTQRGGQRLHGCVAAAELLPRNDVAVPNFFENVVHALYLLSVYLHYNTDYRFCQV